MHERAADAGHKPSCLFSDMSVLRMRSIHHIERAGAYQQAGRGSEHHVLRC
jgi:hypothetical protein